MEDLLGGLEHLVDVVDLVGVALDGQVDEGNLQGHDVLGWHVAAILRTMAVMVMMPKLWWWW